MIVFCSLNPYLGPFHTGKNCLYDKIGRILVEVNILGNVPKFG